MEESKRWEAAERERQLQRTRELHCEHRREHRRELTASLHDSRVDALNESREDQLQRVEDRRREAKELSWALRQERQHLQDEWMESARAIRRADENIVRCRRQAEKVQAERAALVAARTAERQRDEIDKAAAIEDLKRSTQERATRSRRHSKEKMRCSSAHQVRHREAAVDEMRGEQLAREGARDRWRAGVLDSNRDRYGEIARMLSPGRVHDFKRAEALRKAQDAMRIKDERARFRQRFEAKRRIEEERKRQIHDAVRRAEVEGYGDRRRTAYGSFMHSGTSTKSQARADDGRPHGFKHDLPSAKSPAGRWLREYAQVQGAHSRSRESVAVVTV